MCPPRPQRCRSAGERSKPKRRQRASASVSNIPDDSRSSRSWSLNLSTIPFCDGDPGSMKSVLLLLSPHHASTAFDASFGPLPARMCADCHGWLSTHPMPTRHLRRGRYSLPRSLGVAALGSEFSLCHLLHDQNDHLLLRHQALQPCVLPLELPHPAYRIPVYRPVLGPLAGQGHMGHPERPRHLGDWCAICQGLVSVPELGDHLLGTVPLPVRTPHRRILSARRATKGCHSRWTCSAHHGRYRRVTRRPRGATAGVAAGAATRSRGAIA